MGTNGTIGMVACGYDATDHEVAASMGAGALMGRVTRGFAVGVVQGRVICEDEFVAKGTMIPRLIVFDSACFVVSKQGFPHSEGVTTNDVIPTAYLIGW